MRSYFSVPNCVRLNCTHFFMMKIANKQELQKIAFNHSSDIDSERLMNLYKEFTAKPYSFLGNDTTLASDSPLYFRKNLLERI